MNRESGPSQDRWTEADSELFLDRAEVWVPARAEMIDVLCSLVPAEGDDAFATVELGSGDGALARPLLLRFPRCQYLGLDGSELMRERFSREMASFSARAEVKPFRLEEREWRHDLPSPLRCVLTSLAVHHLTEQEKRQMFGDLADRIEPGGALLIGDIVQPGTPEASRLYARCLDAAVKSQSLEITGDSASYDEFNKAGWNHFREPAPDEGHWPSGLYDQLKWLEEAGFRSVDCFWMHAGHAVFGGFASA